MPEAMVEYVGGPFDGQVMPYIGDGLVYVPLQNPDYKATVKQGVNTRRVEYKNGRHVYKYRIYDSKYHYQGIEIS